MARISVIAQRRALARESGDAAYRQRRIAVLEAAAAVFKRKGFHAASLNDIAMEVGLDRASIYYYASSKDELFREIVFDAVFDNVKMAEALRAEKGNAAEKIESLIKKLIHSYAAHYPYLFVYVQEDMAHLDQSSSWGREMHGLSRRFDKAVQEIVQQGLDKGSLKCKVGDARLIANGIIGMCNWSHRWLHQTEEQQVAAISATFSAMILSGLAK